MLNCVIIYFVEVGEKRVVGRKSYVGVEEETRNIEKRE